MTEGFKQNIDKSNFSKEKLLKFIRKNVLIASISIASISSFESCTNIKDYSGFKTFNSAFKKARENGESTFLWNDHKYSTKLVDKEFTEIYLDSKNFLEEYYNSDYFKLKYKADSYDSIFILHDLYDEFDANNPEFLKLEKKLNQNEELNNLENDKLYNFFSQRNSVDKSQRFIDKIDSTNKAEVETRINNLEKPIYFSVTQQKGDFESDGYFDSQHNRMFIHHNKNDITTSIHELTHKSTDGNKYIKFKKIFELRASALESINKNAEFFIKKYKGFRYFIDPSEIDARQNSTRFYLYKKFPDYKADTVFNESHYNFLVKNYNNLPYDVQQLIDIFPDKKIFIYNMNNY